MADYKIPVITGDPLVAGDLLRWSGAAWVNYADSAYQVQGDILDDLVALGPPESDSDGEFIVAAGYGTFAYESGATARTSLGLGIGDNPQFDGLLLKTTDATDPILIFQTTNTVHQMNVFLDEDAGNDKLIFQGQTAGIHTNFMVKAIDGKNAVLYLESGANFSYIVHLSSDNLQICTNTQDKDIVFYVNKGGTPETEVLRLDGPTLAATFAGAISATNYTAANLLTACASNAGELDFTASSKKLDVEGNAVVDQDYSSDASPAFAGLGLTGSVPALTLKNSDNEHGQDEAESLIKFTDHTDAILAQIQGHHENAADDTKKGGLALSTHNGTALTEAIRVDELQRVGVGTSTPEAIFHAKSVSAARVAIFQNPSEAWSAESNILLTVGTGGLGKGAIAWLNRDEAATYESQLQFRVAASDTEPAVKAVLTSIGYFGINTIKPTVYLEVVKNDGSAFANLTTYHTSTTTAGLLTLRHAGGSEASPSLVDDNWPLGIINFDGYDGSGWHTGAKIEARIDGTPSDGTDMPTELVFSTCPNGSATLEDRMSIKNGGNVGIGDTDPETLLELTHAQPYLTLHNSTHEDTDGGGESRLIFKREDGAGTETAAGQIEISHDGVVANDQLAKMILSVNTGAGLAAVIEIDSSANTKIGDGGTTNYTKIEADGTLEFNGAATVFEDINMGAAMLSRPAASQPDEDEFVDENGDDTGIVTLAFAIGEKVSGSVELPHSYKTGSNITFHVHWQGIAALDTGTDNVTWQLTYTVGQNGETLDAATIISTGDIAYDTQYEFLLSSFAAIDGTNFGLEDQFIFTLERIASSGDDYAGDALVATVGLHYELDTVGSRTILTK